ncbi:MAG: hypothetical protein IKG82_10685, partial [Oscillospiraceae bacterium]|nr:hypothetical protein [Oscillospiraceae bacterium]
MKHFDRLLLFVPLMFLLIIAATDILMLRHEQSGRQYLVDANRIEQIILNGDMPSAEQFSSVTGIFAYDGSDSFFRTDSAYLIRRINGVLYRIDYTDAPQHSDLQAVLLTDAGLLILLAVIMGVLFYIRQKILKQFTKLGDVPYQLARGNLTEPLKEDKSRFFGKYIWG